MAPSLEKVTAAGRSSRQLAQADVAEVDRRAFRLQAKEAGPRLDLVAARHLLAVDPQPHLAVDRADVVVVPLVDALAQVLAREAAAAAGRLRLERPHLRLPGREHVAVRR